MKHHGDHLTWIKGTGWFVCRRCGMNVPARDYSENKYAPCYDMPNPGFPKE